VNIRDKHRNTLLHIACAFGRLKSAQTLLKMCPALLDHLDDKGHSALDVAIKHGQLELVKWLLSRTNRLVSDTTIYQQLQQKQEQLANGGGGSRSSSRQQRLAIARECSRRSCLHLAAKHGENEILKYVLSEMHRKRLPLDVQDLNGNTAAHLAAKYNNLDCLQVRQKIKYFSIFSSQSMFFKNKTQSLVEFNSDVTIVNKNGHTPCFVAEFYGNQECVHYLMIVETCINLSLKVVKTSRRLRESRTNNEILKAQMDEV
jgi:ankyrin repeat protein